MAQIGIWEQGSLLRHALHAAGRLFCAARPAQLAGRTLDLLVAAPDARHWNEAGMLNCRIALLPDSAGECAGAIGAGSAVSYGTSPRSTLTLSSVEGDCRVLAIQRELVTVSGTVVERQELVLPCPANTDPDVFLCVTGALILSDAMPMV